MNVNEALTYWQEKGLLTQKKAKELKDSLHREAIPGKALAIFSTIGGLLVGLGIILFVSSNWDQMTDVVKTLLLISTTLVLGIVGYYLKYQRDYDKTGSAFLLINILAYGATIFLIAQIYNVELEFWWGTLLWLLGTLILGYVLESRIHMWLAVPLLVFTIGWYRSHVLGGFGFAQELEFLFDGGRGSIFGLLPAMGIALMSLGILHRRIKSIAFASPTLFHWGLFLALMPLVVSTFDKYVLFNLFRLPTDPVAIVIFAVTVLLVILAVAFGSFDSKQGPAGLIAALVFCIYMYVVSTGAPAWFGFGAENISPFGGYMNGFLSFDAATNLFILHALLAFGMMLLAVWFGTLVKQPIMVNMGMIGVALIIFAQYFSWAFQLLPRSLFFIMGGLVIILFTMALERKRRILLSSFEKSRA